MAVDPENFSWPGVAAEFGNQRNGPIGDGTNAAIDGHNERHALLITTQRALLVLVKALQQVVTPAGLVWI